MTPPKVFVAGPVSENLLVQLDSLPTPEPQTLRARAHWRTVGGTSAGKALNLVSLGAEVALFTAIGDDDAGARVVEVLRGAGVHVFADPTGGRTEAHLNLMDPVGRRISVYLDVPDPRRSAPGGAAMAALAAADVAIVDLADYARPWLAAAAAAGVPVWVDLHDYDGMERWHAAWRDAGAVVFCNDDKLADPEPFLRSVVARGAGAAVATRGPRGAIGVDHSGTVEVSAIPVDPIVDTNGAGDAFVAGFLVARAAGADLTSAMEAGARQAAACLRSPGLAPGTP